MISICLYANCQAKSYILIFSSIVLAVMWNKVKLKVEELSQTDDFNKAIGKIKELQSHKKMCLLRLMESKF